ncbi:MAG: hypothetical protein ABEI07_00290, partial [Candidatus Nanohaloarchaea archaeon]
MHRDDFQVIERGSWEDVVSFCSSLSDVLEDLEEVSREEVQKFEMWRPKPGEDRDVVRSKTAETESLGETDTEKESDGAAKELSRASSRVRRAGENAVKGRPADS